MKNVLVLTVALFATLLSSGQAWSQASTTARDTAVEEMPLYVMGRSSVAIPSEGIGEVVTLGAGFGVVFEPDKNGSGGSEHHLGMRLIWVPNPPKNPLGDEQDLDVKNAWGPVLDWKILFSPERRISLFTSASLGFVYGVPEVEELTPSASGYRDEPTNVVLPILEGGVGVQLSTKELGSSGMHLYVAPELGFVPGILAPYAALTVGLR
mgnify:CR=1 FL=1